jgi:hypothetical protein
MPNTEHVLHLDSPVHDTTDQGGGRTAVYRYVDLNDDGSPAATLFLSPAEFDDLGRPDAVTIAVDPTGNRVPVTYTEEQAAAHIASAHDDITESGTSA